MIGRTWPPGKTTVAGTMRAGAARPSSALCQAPPELAGAPVHPANRHVGSVKNVGTKAGRSKSAGQLQTVMQGQADRGVSAGLFVRRSPGDKKLTAAHSQAWHRTRPHPPDRQKADQDEMDQGDHQLLDESQGLLPRKAAQEIGTRSLQAGSHSSQSIGGEPDVGVDKNQERIRGQCGQQGARMWLAAPERRQGRNLAEPDPFIAHGDRPHDRSRGVARMVVGNDDLEVDIPARQHRLDRGLDRQLFICAGINTETEGRTLTACETTAGWNTPRFRKNKRAGIAESASAPKQRIVSIARKSDGFQGAGRCPCSAMNRCPLAAALTRRHPS